MSLLSDAYEACRYMEKTTINDGYGGVSTAWVEGDKLLAAFEVHFSNSEARKAEKMGVKAMFTATVPKRYALRHDDVIKRLSDGTYFRIVSSDKATPKTAGLDMRQAAAELLPELPE